MAKFELKLPKMGESVAEATITTWLKDIGDQIDADDPLLEIATDKVDSEVPSEVDGVLVEKLFNVDDVVQVGQVLAIIETEGTDTSVVEVSTSGSSAIEKTREAQPQVAVVAADLEKQIQEIKTPLAVGVTAANEGRFYSPLVRNIAAKEGIDQAELATVLGTGKEKRVTKNDILTYIAKRGQQDVVPKQVINQGNKTVTDSSRIISDKTAISDVATPVIASGEDELIEMSRMGKMIAKHMTHSLQTSAHVQSFIEADVTNIWNWRNSAKKAFMAREGEPITFTPIFMEAVAKALKDFPLMNSAVSGTTITKKKNINLGMAAALPDGNLIVPVIKNADQYSLLGMTKKVNDLANRARNNALKPDDIQDGTYTVTNVGTFGSIMGTPIINQPQVGILALGAIRKVPAVIETPDGDFIGIRYRMFLSHSYDHRVINGALGGQFVQRVKEYLEAWDVNREL